MYIYVYAHTFLWVYVGVHMSQHGCGGQQTTLCLGSYRLPFFCFETWFLCEILAVLELNSVHKVGLNLRDPPVSVSAYCN